MICRQASQTENALILRYQGHRSRTDPGNDRLVDTALAPRVPYNRGMTLEAFARLVQSRCSTARERCSIPGAPHSRGSRPVYLLGYNPGSDPGGSRSTVRGSIEEACSRKDDRFSLYYQD